MAALLLFMIGASLLLLRARPGERESMHVTERGVPEPHGDNVAILPVIDQDRTSADDVQTRKATAASARRPVQAPVAAASAEPAKSEAGPGGAANSNVVPDAGTLQSVFQSALTAYHDHHYSQARELFERAAADGGAQAPKAELFAARSVKMASGCSEAIERFELLSKKYAETDVGLDATWHGAECFRELGLVEAARKAYSKLIDSPRFGPRARAALERLTASSTDHPASESDAAAPAGSAPTQTPEASATETGAH
jgi:TolA-binding protein